MAALFQTGSSIPVLRMSEEAAAKAFYVDFLGFEIEWEHRFEDSPESPLYMQIRLGQAVIQLNGHAKPDTPPAEVRTLVRGVQAFCNHLRSIESKFPKPSVVDPRYSGKNTDMNLIAPFENYLVFWEPSHE
ncbi:MAG: glyoxalase superfamily protein [Pedosphaera sp.]|nr:glyoxalase superfamily protein [Pedosphaera sp.]